ncbi:Argininosuccinate lyase [compost metagenome]
MIGKLVLYSIENKKYLLDLELPEFHSFSKLFGDDIYTVLQPEHVVNARNVYGGTASVQVAAAVERAEAALLELQAWHTDYAEKSK